MLTLDASTFAACEAGGSPEDGDSCMSTFELDRFPFPGCKTVRNFSRVGDVSGMIGADDFWLQVRAGVSLLTDRGFVFCRKAVKEGSEVGNGPCTSGVRSDQGA